MEILPAKKYEWNQDWASPVAHTDIASVITELQEIQETRGEITPELLIESSKNKKSVLYKYFEWDDKKAADSWRLRQAKILLSNIEVKTIRNGEPKQLIVEATTVKLTPIHPSLLSTKPSNSIEFAKLVCINDLKRVKNRLKSFSLIELAENVEIIIRDLEKTSNIEEDNGLLG